MTQETLEFLEFKLLTFFSTFVIMICGNFVIWLFLYSSICYQSFICFEEKSISVLRKNQHLFKKRNQHLFWGWKLQSCSWPRAAPCVIRLTAETYLVKYLPGYWITKQRVKFTSQRIKDQVVQVWGVKDRGSGAQDQWFWGQGSTCLAFARQVALGKYPLFCFKNLYAKELSYFVILLK